MKIWNELYLFSMDFALCLTLDILATLFNAFFLVHDSENPKFWIVEFPCTIIIYYPGFQSRFNLLFTEGPAALESRVIY